MEFKINPEDRAKMFDEFRNNYKKLIKLIKKSESSDDSEIFHDIRTTIRRLQSFIDFIPSGYNSKKLIKIRDKFFNLAGKIRDIQIQKEFISNLEAISFDKDEYFLFLNQREKKVIKNFIKINTKENRRKLKKEFDNYYSVADKEYKRTEKFKNNIEKAYKNMIGINEEIGKEIKGFTDKKKLHELRIKIKSIRYISEILSRFYDIRQNTLKKYEKYQIKLGEIQDMEIIARTLKKYGRKNNKNIDKVILEIVEIKKERENIIIQELKEW